MIAGPARLVRCPAGRIAIAVGIPFFMATACDPGQAPPGPGRAEVIVHSQIAADRLQPVFDAYAAETGVRVRLVGGEAAAVADEMHRAQGKPQPDLFIADDIAGLWQAVEDNVVRPTRSEAIARRIPARLRDPAQNWVALSARFRMVVYNPDLAAAAELANVTGYASLGGDTWRGRLCLSSSAVAGNRSLIAMLINDLGADEAERIVRGWRANLATHVSPDDRGLLEAVARGDCAIGVADSGAIAQFLESASDAKLLPHRFAAGGVVHVNVRGGGVTRHAGNAAGAVALLEWLTSATANAMFAAALLELPTNPDAAVHEANAAWAGAEANPVNVANLGFLVEDAAKLAERARYP